MKNINPTQSNSWERLRKHHASLKDFHLKKAFSENPNRAEDLTITHEDFYVDLSKNLITLDTTQLLVELAEECGLKQAIDSCFSGEKINKTENRKVLHTALRTPIDQATSSIQPQVKMATDSNNKMYSYVDKILSGEITAHNGQKFTDVVNIGIGGSDLGPEMISEALAHYKTRLKVHFISNIDGDHLTSLLEGLPSESTLFLVVSKSFGTQETLTNATTIKHWFQKKHTAQAVHKHFTAVTCNVEKATEFGALKENILPMFGWVGGRFSIWGTVGLSIALAVGTEHFKKFLEGANEMDKHFQSTTFSKNIPVQLALINIWYNNFYNTTTEAIIPYSQYLHRLPAYLQQAAMESNGKSISRAGETINYQTGNIVWGAPGTNAQHAFFQLFHQGTKLIPSHFIAFAKTLNSSSQKHHEILISNFIAQSEALMNGKTKEEVVEDLKISSLSKVEQEELIPFQVFKGNKPTTSILVDKLTPKSLGKLIAMYEHKIFTEGIIWNVYSFDQWGVQLGKELAATILTELTSNQSGEHDGSTTSLKNRYKTIN